MQLKDYVDEVLRLEGEKDALVADLARAQRMLQQQQQQQQQQVPGMAPSFNGAGGREQGEEEQLFELLLLRDQAQAAATRLRARLEELFGPGASDPGATRGSGGGGERPASSRRPRPDAPSSAGPDAAAATVRRAVSGGGSSSATGGGGGLAKLSRREAELFSTVNNLRASLERAMAENTPTTRFVQVCPVARTPHTSFSLVGGWLWCLYKGSHAMMTPQYFELVARGSCGLAAP